MVMGGAGHFTKLGPDPRSQNTRLKSDASSLSGSHALSKSSKFAGYLTLSHDAWNYHYRLLVDYLAGKDNLSTA